jgi:hypothetical protein
VELEDLRVKMGISKRQVFQKGKQNEITLLEGLENSPLQTSPHRIK